jgi:hypothetical protein
MYEKIDFSYNWNNKLNCKCFTTLRLKNEKYKVGNVYEITLKGGTMFFAKIIAIKTLKISHINDFIAAIDTGYSADEMKQLIKTMYKNKVKDIDNQDFVLILLQRI